MIKPRMNSQRAEVAEDDHQAAEGTPIELTGTHEHGMNVVGWIDGKTVAVITWEGWDVGTDLTLRPAPGWEDGRPAGVRTYTRTVTSEREALNALGSIDHYVNLRLVSAVLVTR